MKDIKDDLYQYASRGFISGFGTGVELIPLSIRTLLREAADEIDRLERNLDELSKSTEG